MKSTCLLIACLLLGTLAIAGPGAGAAGLQQAQELYDAGQADAAIELLLSSDLSPWRGSVVYEFLLGNCYLKREKMPEAVSAFTKAISAARSPEDLAQVPEMKRLLAGCYTAIKDWTSAASIFESLASGNPNGAAYCLYTAGDCYVKAGKQTEAISAFERGIASANLPADHAYMMEMTRLLAGCYSAALDDASARNLYKEGASEAKAAAEQQSDAQKRISLTVWLAECYRQSGDLDNAISTYERLLSDPHLQSPATVRFSLAACLEQKKDYPRAIELYNQIVSGDNSSKEIRRLSVLYVAQCLREQGRRQEEIDYLKSIVSRDPVNALEATIWIVEDGLLPAKDYDGAVQALEQVEPDPMVHSPEVIRARTTMLAFALEQAGRLDEAALVIRSAITDSDAPDVKAAKVHEIVNIYLRASRWGEASALLLEEMTLVPQNAAHMSRASYLLGFCYHQMGDTQTGRKYMNRVIADYPDTEFARRASEWLRAWSQPGD